MIIDKDFRWKVKIYNCFGYLMGFLKYFDTETKWGVQYQRQTGIDNVERWVEQLVHLPGAIVTVDELAWQGVKR